MEHLEGVSNTETASIEFLETQEMNRDFRFWIFSLITNDIYLQVFLFILCLIVCRGAISHEILTTQDIGTIIFSKNSEGELGNTSWGLPTSHDM
jgi:hypothetical protein